VVCALPRTRGRASPSEINSNADGHQINIEHLLVALMRHPPLRGLTLDLNVRRLTRWISLNISRTFPGHEYRLSDDEV
jgi:hypothetical protein